MAKAAVRPGLSIPTQLTRFGTPFEDSSRMIKSRKFVKWSLGRMPA